MEEPVAGLVCDENSCGDLECNDYQVVEAIGGCDALAYLLIIQMFYVVWVDAVMKLHKKKPLDKNKFDFKMLVPMFLYSGLFRQLSSVKISSQIKEQRYHYNVFDLLYP